MVDLLASTARLLAALFLVGLNGFYVASEFAFVRVRDTAVEQLAAEGRRGAATLQEVMDNLDDYLAATQLGITIASLGLGWIGEPAVAALIEPLLAPVLPERAIHLVAFAVGFSIVTFLHVVFGELAPKTMAIAQAERLALFLAPPMKLSYLVFVPGIVVFNGTANAFTRLLGVPPASETEETLEEREIRRVLGRAGDAGTVDEREVRMIERVFELDDTVVREVMVPRPDVTSATADASLAELRETILEAGHTRLPVLAGEAGDRVVGFVDARDVLGAEGGDQTARALSRELPVVPEMTTVSDLLVQFREEDRQMAAVVDEWGAFEGVVTVEDVVEAVVGDLRDAFDAGNSDPAIRPRAPGTFEANGTVALSTVNDALDTDLSGDGYETLGGLVFDRLGAVPSVGDGVDAGGYRIEVTAVDGQRVEAVRITADGDGDGDEHGQPVEP